MCHRYHHLCCYVTGKGVFTCGSKLHKLKNVFEISADVWLRIFVKGSKTYHILFPSKLPQLGGGSYPLLQYFSLDLWESRRSSWLGLGGSWPLDPWPATSLNLRNLFLRILSSYYRLFWSYKLVDSLEASQMKIWAAPSVTGVNVDSVLCVCVYVCVRFTLNLCCMLKFCWHFPYWVRCCFRETNEMRLPVVWFPAN